MGKPKKRVDRIKQSVNLSPRVALRLSDFEGAKSLESKSGVEVILYVDMDYKPHLMELLQDRLIRKKFRRIADFLRANNMDKDIYGSEKSSPKSKDVYAMKIRVKGNYRIYCKEFGFPGVRRIVLITHRYKKTENLNKELRTLIDTIGEYQYDFKDNE